MSNRKNEMRAGLDFEGLRAAMEALTDEEQVELGLVETRPLRNGLEKQDYGVTLDGKYIPTNHGSGIHLTGNDGFSHGPNVSYLTHIPDARTSRKRH